MKTRQSRLPQTCEASVASAAPGMPQSKTRIAIGSKMMLSESPEASSIVGVLLSPSARMRFVCVWKKTKSVMPA